MRRKMTPRRCARAHLSEPERVLASVHCDLSKRGANSVGEPRTEVLAWLEGDFWRKACTPRHYK
jgi:hypothetical protein